jgi:predicted HicB family RNase H-like nuclease
MHIKQDKRIGNIAKRYHKTKNINLRVTPGEHERNRRAAASQGLNITQWFEQLIFGKDEDK